LLAEIPANHTNNPARLLKPANSDPQAGVNGPFCLHFHTGHLIFSCARSGAPAKYSTMVRAVSCIAKVLSVCLLGFVMPQLGAVPADVQVDAHFEPAEIFAEKHSQLVVDVCGATKQTVEPQVHLDSAKVQRMQALYEVQSDGRFHSQYTYLVSPWGTGKFTLNSSVVVIDGHMFPIPATTLTVRENVLALESAVAQFPHIAELKAQIPAQTLYLGQTVPAAISLSMQNGVRFRLDRSHPEKMTNAFRVGSGIDAPIGDYVSISGEREHQREWQTLVTATRIGTQNLAFVCGVSVVLPEAAMPQNYAKLFDQLPQWVPLSVTSPQYAIAVMPLPETNRPHDFSGAIGQFRLCPATIQTPVVPKAGKSIELVFVVEGEGNLQDMGIPELPLDDHWRLYRTRKIVEPEDRLGFSGKVMFHYTIVPQVADALMLPPFSFCFFNPQTREYSTLVYEFESPLAFSSAAAKTIGPKSAKCTLGDILAEKLPLQTSMGPTARSFSSLWSSYLFWILQGFLLWFYVWFILSLWRRYRHARYGLLNLHQVRSPEIKALLLKARQACERENQILFYETLREALLATLAYVIRRNQTTLAVHGLLEVLRSSEDRLRREYFEKIRSYLNAADDIRNPQVPKHGRRECEKNWENVVRLIEVLQEINL
jgi:hypothetical protein